MASDKVRFSGWSDDAGAPPPAMTRAEQAVDRFAQLERAAQRLVAGLRLPLRASARRQGPSITPGMLRPDQEMLPLPEMLLAHRRAAAAGGVGEIQAERIGDQIERRGPARELVCRSLSVALSNLTV